MDPYPPQRGPSKVTISEQPTIHTFESLTPETIGKLQSRIPLTLGTQTIFRRSKRTDHASIWARFSNSNRIVYRPLGQTYQLVPFEDEVGSSPCGSLCSFI